MNSVIKSFLIGVGTLSIALGILGIFLPVLPTTPFLLLSGACYMRSSENLYHRLINNKWLGHYILDYNEKRGIPLRAKVISVSLLWFSIGISVIFFVKILWLRIILFFVAIGVTGFLLSQKTLKRDSIEMDIQRES